MLTIQQTRDGETVTIALDGRLDSGGASQLETELQQALRKTKELVFDLEKLGFISTAGLRVLLLAQRQMNRQGRMRLIHVSEAVLQTLEIQGVVDILNIS